jgi:hypothetical protein
MKDPKRYVGIDNDLNGGMTPTGKIIRDAWAFGLIPETETCEGWFAQGIESLWERVNNEWEKYGFRVVGMPPELQERYMRIQDEALKRAKEAGWSGDRELLDDD